jgi:ERCC4-type nuclease
MALSIPFDTHTFVKKLTAAGMPELQAEVQAQAIADLVNDQLATKRDLQELELRLNSNLKDLELRLANRLRELELSLEQHRTSSQRDIRESELRLKHELTLRLGAMMAVAVAIVGTLASIF